MSKFFCFRIKPCNEAYLFAQNSNVNLGKETPSNPFKQSKVRYVIVDKYAYLIFSIKTWHIFDLPKIVYTSLIKLQMRKKNKIKEEIKLLKNFELFKLLEGLLWDNKK